jgi:uncharacterized protein YqjF (DUF2071 family)
MKPSDILGNVTHRSCPLPTKKWRWYQEWNDAVFIHGAVAPELLQSLIPAGIKLDIYEGKAWISIVVFKMERIRHKFSPSFRPVSDFYEINIRTYVTNDDMPGVFFLNMEGGKRFSSWIANKVSGLPYCYEAMQNAEGHFRSKGISHRYKAGKDFERDELANWLTERYAVYYEKSGQLYRYQVHHGMWPLKEVELNELNITYPILKEKFNWQPELFHYSPGVQVLAWPAEKL